jgi:hypothetical protein
MDQALTTQQKVIDLDGVEIGTVDRIYRESERGTLRSEPIRAEARFGIGYLQIGARVTDLGRTLYVPFSEIVEIVDGMIRLDVHKATVEQRDWDLRPTVLDEPQWQEA